MEINVSKQNERIVLAIDGRIDTITAPELEKTIQSYVIQPNITLIFDCKKVTFVSSSGLRVILMAHKQVTAKNGTFILQNLIPEVQSVIDMTGFSRIITIE